MKFSAALFFASGVLIGLIIGFSTANLIARNEIFNNRNSASNNVVEPSVVEADLTNKAAPDVLSQEEITQAISSADTNKDNLIIQRNIGLALYKYAKIQRQIEYLPEIRRILLRALTGNDGDFELLVALGETAFIIGQQPGKSNYLVEARKYYSKALIINPDASELKTDLGSTYFFAQPPEPDKAVAEYLEVVKNNPRDERALQFLASAYIMIGKIAEAETRIAALRNINPENQALPDLTVRLAQKKLEK